MSTTQTSISWTDVTWNALRGCSRVSTGCEHCYAESQAGRFSGSGQPYEGLVRKTSQGWKWTGDIKLITKDLELPLHWKKPRRIFVNSMSDLFHENVPDIWLLAIFDVIRQCPQHTFQILTKRAKRQQDFCARLRWDNFYNAKQPRHLPIEYRTQDGGGVLWLADSHDGPGYPLMGCHRYTGMHWVWLGVSVENQDTADERIPWLLNTPAAVRFISYEPALGPVDFTKVWCTDGDRLGPYLHNLGMDTGLDWVICGGESGSKARPCDLEWLQSCISQCSAAGIACFVKQIGSHPEVWNKDHTVMYQPKLYDRKGADPSEWPNDLQVQQFPGV